MKSAQTPRPKVGRTPQPLTTRPIPRLWPQLAPEHQHRLAQCLAQLILRLHGMPQEPAPQEASHERT
jgi:hypothetical protein